jgi:hypothetical protein
MSWSEMSNIQIDRSSLTMTKRSCEDINVDQLIDTINLDKGLHAGVLELTAGNLAVDVLCSDLILQNNKITKCEGG